MYSEKKTFTLSFASLYTVDLQCITAAGQRSPRLLTRPFSIRASPSQWL